MNRQKISSLLRLRKAAGLQIALLAFFLILCGVCIVSSTAQTPENERELEDKIPKHLPIQVKVKNLNNKKWTSDLEVEVKNTGGKPIYFLMFSLFFVDVKMENGDDIGFPFRYGRPELYIIENKASPEDVPIQPGETYVFKAPKSLADNWEKFRSKRNMSHPKKIGIRFRALNFGDGTGFRTTGGIPVPKPRASKATCGGERGTRILTTAKNFQDTPPLSTSPQLLLSPVPVKFLPANFSSLHIAEVNYNLPTPQSGLCCPGTSCSNLRDLTEKVARKL